MKFALYQSKSCLLGNTPRISTNQPASTKCSLLFEIRKNRRVVSCTKGLSAFKELLALRLSELCTKYFDLDQLVYKCGVVLCRYCLASKRPATRNITKNVIYLCRLEVKEVSAGMICIQDKT